MKEWEYFLENQARDFCDSSYDGEHSEEDDFPSPVNLEHPADASCGVALAVAAIDDQLFCLFQRWNSLKVQLQGILTTSDPAAITANEVLLSFHTFCLRAHPSDLPMFAVCELLGQLIRDTLPACHGTKVRVRAMHKSSRELLLLVSSLFPYPEGVLMDGPFGPNKLKFPSLWLANLPPAVTSFDEYDMPLPFWK